MGLRKEAETWLRGYLATWLRGYMAIKVAAVLEVWMPLEYCDAIFSLNICGLLIVFNFKAVLFQKLKGTQLPSRWFLWKKKKRKASIFFADQEQKSRRVPWYLPKGQRVTFIFGKFLTQECRGICAISLCHLLNYEMSLTKNFGPLAAFSLRS